MTRVRTDNVFGTITDNPLTSGATTMNSAGLANLAAVASADAIIILDPNRLTGAPEIVRVTAHTGSATSATISRGQFGTTARQHAQGTQWVHGPIASNATSFTTASDNQGDFPSLDGWETFTPSLVQSGAVTKTVTYAKFMRIGRTVFVVVDLSCTGSGTGANDVVVGLPVNASATGLMVGTALIFDSSAGLIYPGITEINAGAATVKLRSTQSTTNGFLGSVSFTAALASGDLVRYSATYEASS